MAEKNQVCHEQSVINLQAAFTSAGSSLWKILCQQFKTVINGLKGIFQAQILVLEPVLTLEEVFVQNFVVFPAETLASTIGSVSDAGDKLRELGITRDCSAHSTIYENIDGAAGPMKSAVKFLEDVSDSAQAEIGRSRSRISKLHDTVDKTFEDFGNIQCP